MFSLIGKLVEYLENDIECLGFSLEELDLSGFDTSNVVYMFNMFSSCSSLTSLDLSSFNTSKVEGMDNMFSYCTSLISLDLSSFDTSSESSLTGMFDNCTKLAWVKVGAKTAVISCGRNNIYGHPAPQTIDRLRESGMTIYRTDQDGAILTPGDGG